MNQPIVSLESVNVDDVQKRLPEFLGPTQAGQLRVVIEREGTAVGAIVSMDDLRRLQKQDADWRRAYEALERIGEAFADVPEEELDREIERALAEVREEMRAERAAATAR